MNETKSLVSFLADMSYNDLPVEVVATAKLCLLDTLGVGLFASQTEWARMVANTVAEAGGADESAVWGHGLRTTAQYAALANGVSAHGIEMDDRKPDIGVHTGSMTIPAAIAAAEKARASGKRVITATVAGYEAAFRVGKAVPEQTSGIHSPGHKGIWGSVAAASKALDLNGEQTLNAFGIAGSMASAISEFSQDPQRNMVKRLHGGWASHNGMMASLLALKGITGPSAVLEGKFGYCRVYGGGEDPRLEELTKELGNSFQILEREVKPYAAWGGSHSCIQAVARLKEQYRIEPREIERIVVGGPRKLITSHEMKRPQSIMAGQYSLPFIIGIAFFEDLRDPAVWRDEILRDQAVLNVVDKVEWYVDEEMERIHQRAPGYYGAKVTVKLRDGTERHAVVHDPKGTQHNPMTSEEIHAKFSLLAGRVLPDSRVKEITRIVDFLEEVDDVRRVGDLLCLSKDAIE